MRAEIIAVGTELLMGQVVNTNATFLSEQLTGLGYQIYFQTVVGDNRERLNDCLSLATERSDLIVLTGGLGPTEDDLTRETLAHFLDAELAIDQAGLEKIIQHFTIQGRELTDNNRKQALSLVGGQTLTNPTGLAVGDFYQTPSNAYLLLPGPPSEMKPMFLQEAVPLLQDRLPQNNQLFSRVMRFFGIGESQLVTVLADEISGQTNPTIAPYAAPNEVRLRLTAQARNNLAANQLLDSLEKRIMALVGDYFYGYGEENSLVKETVQALKDSHATLAVAESLTAGLVQSTLGQLPGVSEVFVGGFVTYSNEMKQQLLGVEEATLAKHGAVSRECAKEMAVNTRRLTGADYALSLTGVAGPSEVEGKAVGTTWIALAKPDGTVQTQAYRFTRDRTYIQHSAMMNGLNSLRIELLNKK
ncbi:competence/damage-inducible protein A [Vagococcus xieshaowenii]|uniref:Putative competence-damage inducible protein n=1 Tax=Vagococcus xieshaowenii TaxID=2562451 RepID=A0AAJ5EF14_9ENTE|nr:competence/damage-inducible protein A [Vagococcus xieshaowenii]QCA29312.1 competence/damage-inducible protein A [Vagococcus xieshaowenii]TFZ41993.1 competence/damage-inducible protein A [Vagococcus xieshaowenii]